MIMDCRVTAAHRCRTKLGFKQYDVVLTKKQSVITNKGVHLKDKIYKHNKLY